MNHPPTREQSAVIHAMAGTENLLVDAVAGSGKTTTIAEGAEGCPDNTLALAFSKISAKDLAKKMPLKVKTATTHSIGFAAWKRTIQPNCIIDKDKVFTIIKQLIADKAIDEPEEAKDLGAVKQLVAMMKLNGLTSDGAGIPLQENTPELLQEICMAYEIDAFMGESWLFHAANLALTRSVFHAYEGLLDFDDMLYMPVVFSSPFDRYSTVIVDEAQDLSDIQHKMIKRLTNRVIAVGDPYQSIYGFRGANTNSMDILQEEFGMNVMPLSICFRCPKKVVYEAQRYVPHIECYDDKEYGEVQTRELGPEDIPRSATVICRNNAPLMDWALKLLAKGEPVRFLNRSIGATLTAQLKRACKQKGPKVTIAVPEYTRQEEQKARHRNMRGVIARLWDQHDCIMMFVEHPDDEMQTVADRIAQFSRSVANRMDGIIFTTIHGAKGLEWDNVYFLAPELIPSSYATSQEQLQQESNAAYVAVTRAMKTLTYVPLGLDR